MTAQEPRVPGLLRVEGSIGSTLYVGTDYRVAEIREHHEPTGVKGEPPVVTTVIRFDPVPDGGLDVAGQEALIERITDEWYRGIHKTMPDALRAALRATPSPVADPDAGPWKCRVCGGLGAHTVTGADDVPDHAFRPPE